MNISEYWLALSVIGLASGFLSGALGVGAGVIMIPALVMLSYPQKSAQGVALAVMVPMALVGAIRYKLNPEIDIDLRIIALIGICAVVGVFGGTALAAALPGAMLRKIFALFLIAAAIRLLTMK